MKISFGYFATLLSLMSIFSACQDDVNDVIDNNQEPVDEQFVLKEKSDIQISEAQKKMVAGQESFALNCFQSLLDSQKGNFAFSPLSLSMLLSMTANGAEETARQEIARVLGDPDGNIENLNALNKKLAEELVNLDNSAQLGFVNAGWCNLPYQFAPAFESKTSEDYSASLKSMDFSSSSALAELNRWFDEATHGLVPEMYKTMPGGDLILSNTSYFKGAWTLPFDKSLTRQEDFLNADGSLSKVDMMQLKHGNLYYFHSNECDMVHLPFGNEAFSAYFFMPHGDMDLEMIKDLLSYENRQILATVEKFKTDKFFFDNKLEVNLPKFKVDCMLENMKDVVLNAGVKELFDSPISGILDGTNTAINLIHQKNVFQIDEDGAEGASISNGILNTVDFSGVVRVPKITFDKPFFFMIDEASTGSILFMGFVRNF